MTIDYKIPETYFNKPVNKDLYISMLELAGILPYEEACRVLTQKVDSHIGIPIPSYMTYEWDHIKNAIGVYEIWTHEYVDRLANYLRGNGYHRVIEYGAGRGNLSHYLRERGVPIVAIDNGSWELKPEYPVTIIKEEIECWLKHYEPDCIICSWHIRGHDFTAHWRTIPSLREYILIGEGPGGCCANHETFGYKEHRYDKYMDVFVEVEPKASPQKDGWKMTRLPLGIQLDRNDGSTDTLSFTRSK